MKKYSIFAASLVLGMVLAISAPAMAQTAPVNIGVVDLQKIIKESKATKDINDQLSKKLEESRKAVAAQEDKLRAADNELMKQKAVLAPKELNEKRLALQKQAVTMQQDVNMRKQQLDSGFAKAMAKVMDVVRGIVEKQAKAKNLTMVLSKQQVIYNQENLDITDEVLSSLNSELSSVKVDFSTPKADSGAKKDQ